MAQSRTVVVSQSSNNTTELKLYLKDNSNEEKVEQKNKQEKKKAPRRSVTWTEDTIDNEHSGNLKSNLCCIYHGPNDESSDTCTSDDEGNALQRDRQTKKAHKLKCSKRKNKPKQNEHDGCCQGHK